MTPCDDAKLYKKYKLTREEKRIVCWVKSLWGPKSHMSLWMSFLRIVGGRTNGFSKYAPMTHV